MTRFDFPCGSCVVSVVLFLENWLQSGFTACNLTASEIVSEINKVKVLTLEAGEVLTREHLLCMSISRHSQTTGCFQQQDVFYVLSNVTQIFSGYKGFRCLIFLPLAYLYSIDHWIVSII